MERLEKRVRRKAQEMRREPTPAEEALWARLRDRQLLGLKFRRQTLILRYIADFCCPDLRLIIEVDGDIHATEAQSAHDQNRDDFLRAYGYEVLRFRNEEVLLSSRSVLETITQAARRLRPDLRG
ncbi:MAG TPA: endonuclease domain-containing protein [Thermoanaerobaculia bacterium]|nr:endonuclease domain-containing protein [Thermoanaerobaculia bacterium]